MQWIYWLIAISLSLGAGYLVFRADKRRAVPYPLLTSALRSLVVFFTLLLILVPTIVITKHVTEKPVILVLQDNSRSIGNALGADTTGYRKRMVDLVQKLQGQYKVVEWGFGGNIQQDSVQRYHQEVTDISMALSRAQEFFGMQNLGAVVLATDGRFNQGMNPVYQQLALHSPVYTVAIGDSVAQKDIRVARLYGNKTATLNSSFEIRADVIAELCKGHSGTVSIKEGGELLSSVPLSVNADKYDKTFSFTIKASKAGLHHYTVSVPGYDGEKNEANNRKDIFVEVVDEKKNILIVSSAPHPDVNAVREALAGVETYKVTVNNGDDLPPSFANYDVIVAHGLPSARNNISARLLAAKKPVWFIVGTQSNVPAINELSQLTHTTINPAVPHNIQLGYNSAFNAFTLPQQIQSVTDKLPPLYSNAGNILPGPGSSILFNQVAGNVQNPAWVLQPGQVPVAILLGEGLWRWRLYEFKSFNDHTVVDECIRQTVSFLAANNGEKPFAINLPKYVWSDQEPVSLTAHLLNANNEQINTPDVQIEIADSNGRKQNFSFERSGGSYSLNIGIWAGGTYSYHGKVSYNDKTYAADGSFVVEAMPLELMETGADYPLLHAIANKYGGSLVSGANMSSLYDTISRSDRVKPLIVTNTETVPLVDRKWYFFIILALAVAEWLLRKYWLAQ